MLRSSINGTKRVREPAHGEGLEGREMTCCAGRNLRGDDGGFSRRRRTGRVWVVVVLL